jgi:hypothetical protein
MKITACFHGILADWVGTPSAVFELTNDAIYADLIKEIRQRFGDNMPDQLWDAEKDTFHQKVRASSDGKVINRKSFKLRHGEVLTFYLMIAGG